VTAARLTVCSGLDDQDAYATAAESLGINLEGQ
jgi:hypothetical protein